MKRTTPIAVLAGLALIAGSLVAASPAAAVTASYANPVPTVSGSSIDLASVDVDYGANALSLTAHVQNLTDEFEFDAYFTKDNVSTEHPGDYIDVIASDQKGSAPQTGTVTQVGGATATDLSAPVTYVRNDAAGTLTVSIPASLVPWGGNVYASAIIEVGAEYHPAGVSAKSNGFPTGWGPIAKGQLATSVSLASTGSTQKHGKSYITYFATVGPATVPGSVQFFEGSNLLAIVAQSGGVAAFAAPSLGLGTHAIHAVFVPADGNYTASASAAVNVKVVSSGKATKTKISLSSHTQHYKRKGVRVSVKVTSTKATGTVVLYSGKTKLATAKLKKGRAHFTVRKTLTKGTKKITVKYVPKNIDAYTTSRSKVSKLKVVK